MIKAQHGVHCEREGAVVTITIDNQRKRNAFSGDMGERLNTYLEEAEADRRVRVVIVTGAGDVAFSSGHDMNEMLANRDHAFSAEANAGFMKPKFLSVPVIAAVSGVAYAAGFILAMSCDLRIASENARFAAPGAKNGLLPIGGQISSLFHLLPEAKVLELLYTGEPMSAQEALALGFINQLVPTGHALLAARTLAARIAANSPTVVAEIKRGVRHAMRYGIPAGEYFEWATARVLKSMQDVQEGVSAFLEKRTPRFPDRQ